MSGASVASVASTTSAVPGGPMTGSGFGPIVVTQRVVMTSDRSVMWSLCRWVSSSAVRPAAWAPAAAARIRAPRPQSTRNCWPPAETRVDGPARFGSTIGLPVPSRVMSIIVTVYRLHPGRRMASHGCAGVVI